MKWLLLILVLLSNFITPIGIEASDVARITACDYPLYGFEHPDGDKRGFDVEVVEEAFQQMGLTAVFEFYPWARALQMTKDGEVTALLYCIDTPERRSSSCPRMWRRRTRMTAPSKPGPTTLALGSNRLAYRPRCASSRRLNPH